MQRRAFAPISRRQRFMPRQLHDLKILASSRLNLMKIAAMRVPSVAGMQEAHISTAVFGFINKPQYKGAAFSW